MLTYPPAAQLGSCILRARTQTLSPGTYRFLSPNWPKLEIFFWTAAGFVCSKFRVRITATRAAKVAHRNALGCTLLCNDTLVHGGGIWSTIPIHTHIHH